MQHTQGKTSWRIGMEQRDNCLQWTCGVDAVTLVGIDHRSALVFYNEYETLSMDVEIAASREKPWGMHGFKGKQRGSVRVGLKDDRAIISVTGPLSERLVSLYRTVACKFTRIDLQVTCKMDGPVRFLAREMWESWNLTNKRNSGKLHQTYMSSNEGDTLYFNKRTATQFARIYDKSLEYAYPLGKIWRFELELKQDLAERMGGVLANAERPQELLSDYVVSSFYDLEVCVPVGIPNRVSLPEMPKGVSGNEQTLSWLTNQVKPSIDHLIEVGLREKVQEALGIQLNLPEEDQERIDF